MVQISKPIRDWVFTRANYRCEYCLTPQEFSGSQMNLEHIVPIAQGGSSDTDNLCLSCAWCNSYKWAKTTGTDPETSSTFPLFNPRQQKWQDHFQWDESETNIIGLTAVGRATIATLKMNNIYIVPARRHWLDAGWRPHQINL